MAKFIWTDERVADLIRWTAEGKTYKQIGLLLGCERQLASRKRLALAEGGPVERSSREEKALGFKPHVYRTPRKIDMGPVVTAALEAVYERRWRNASATKE